MKLSLNSNQCTLSISIYLQAITMSNFSKFNPKNYWWCGSIMEILLPVIIMLEHATKGLQFYPLYSYQFSQTCYISFVNENNVVECFYNDAVQKNDGNTIILLHSYSTKEHSHTGSFNRQLLGINNGLQNPNKTRIWNGKIRFK